MRFSLLSGLPKQTDVKVEIDGIDLGWEPMPEIGVDRWHSDIHRDDDLEGGEHHVQFTLLNSEREGIAQLCNLEILEFGAEDECVFLWF